MIKFCIAVFDCHLLNSRLREACLAIDDNLQVGAIEMFSHNDGYQYVVILYGREYEDFSSEERAYFELATEGSICSLDYVAQYCFNGRGIVDRYRKWNQQGILVKGNSVK